jgi:hypothetical protein
VLLPTVRVSPLSGTLQLSLKLSSSSSELEAVVARLTTAALVVAAVAAGALVTEPLAVAGQLMTSLWPSSASGENYNAKLIGTVRPLLRTILPQI